MNKYLLWLAAVVGIISIAGNAVQFEMRQKNNQETQTTATAVTMSDSCGALGEGKCQGYTDDTFGFNVRYPIDQSLTINRPQFDAIMRNLSIGKIINILTFTPGAYGSTPAEYAQRQSDNYSFSGNYQAGYTKKLLGSNALYTFKEDVVIKTTNYDFGAPLQGLIFGKDYTYEFYFTEANRTVAENIIGTFQLR